MMPAKSEFVQRIRTSINKYFDAQKGVYTLFIEGQVPSIPGQDSWAELRINGPILREVTKGEWKVDIGIDIMCSAKQTNDLYLIDKVVGQFVAAMVDFVVTSTGSTFWFCLKRQERINTTPWGLVSKGDLNVYSTSVGAEYEGEFRWP